MLFFSHIRMFYRKKLQTLYAILLIFFACGENDGTAGMSDNRDFPSRSLIDAHVIYKDSGFIKIDLHSPLIEEYEMLDSPYTLFPKGLHMNYFNKNIDSPGFLKADWARMSETKGYYEGRGNVVVINEKGDTLKTDKLFWNKTERQIFTKDTVYIITKTGDSIQANNGLEAKDDLSEYMLFNNQGIKYYDEKKH